jgi:hypothetical protein
MSKANQSIFPTQEFGESGRPISDLSGGLTKREYLAAMAMQGILAKDGYRERHGLAWDAVNTADALLAVLAK